MPSNLRSSLDDEDSNHVIIRVTCTCRDFRISGMVGFRLSHHSRACPKENHNSRHPAHFWRNQCQTEVEHRTSPVTHTQFKMTKRTKKVGVTYVSLCPKSKLFAVMLTIVSAVNMVSGKLPRKKVPSDDTH